MSEQIVTFTSISTDFDLSNVDTSVILPMEGQAVLRCVSLIVEANKKGDGNNLVLTAVPAAPMVDTQGRPLNPAYQFKQWISLKKVYDENGVEKNAPERQVAKLAEALVGKPLPAGFSLGTLLASAPGQEFAATLKHEVAKDGSGTNVRINPLAKVV